MRHLRVTEVLYPFGGLKYVDPVVLENAAERGTRVHKICEGIVSGIEGWKVDPDLEGYVDSFLRWWRKGHVVVASEKRFFCEDLGITGQCDMIIQGDDGKHVVVDLKTSLSESKSWMLQGSAYSYLAKKSGYDVSGIMFMRLRRDGSEPKYHWYDENMTLFKECLNVYKYFYAKKKDLN